MRIKSSDSQAYSDALLELNASSIEYATRRRLYELSSHRLNHEESQDNSENDDENDDENEAAEAV